MTTEIYIEKLRLDITNDISTLLTFGLDDLKDFSARSTTFSKTIVLPGTANNNKLFGHIFQIGQSNQYISTVDNVGYNYNASKSADCIVFQDQIQTFTGVLRLMQINISQGRIEYEVAVFGKLSGLNVALSSGLLEDLDFSAYNEVFNSTNITASWNNAGGSDLYYPLIDYGNYSTLKKNWDIRTLRPALYAKEYIDKMFAAAGFRYTSTLFETARFKSLVIPHNQKELTKISATALDVSYSGAGQELDDPDTYLGIQTPTHTTLGAFTTGDDITYTYGGAVQVTGTITVRLIGTIYYGQDNPSQYNVGIGINTVQSGTNIGDAHYFSDTALATIDFDVTLNVTAAFNNGDTVTIFEFANLSAINPEDWALIVTSATIVFTSSSLVPVPIAPGDSIIINDLIPKNVRQIDFLLGIVKLFNLYIYEDRFDPSLIYITPYVDFYTTNSTDAVDWSYKLNRDKVLQIRPMSEINAKKYEFKYKPDSDYYNDLYSKRYGQGYGDYIFDSLYEFAEQTKAFEIVFSATPLVGYVGEDKVMSTIFKKSNAVEDHVDSNIRILQTKKITGVTSWNILDGVAVLTSTTDYGYAGHFDDPDAPDNDLNFGALRELFFVLAAGNLTNTQFNIYWSSYMAEITDKDSKLIAGHFYLTTQDIFDLDFSKFIYLDGVLFRLSKIEDYNITVISECKVELLKVNFLIY